MPRMDDIFLPDETPVMQEDTGFRKKSLDDKEATPVHAGPHASTHIKITFDRFVTLVANHSFIDVVERNKDEEIIMSSNLLTDLANSRGLSPKTRGPLLLAAGIVIGIFIAYFIFNG